MRLLHARHSDDAHRAAARHARPERTGSARRAFRQSLPLHGVSGHRGFGTRRGEAPAHGDPAMSGRVFGQSVRRREDAGLLLGKGRFIDDVRLPGMLEAAFVRSPHAHASLERIDKTAALAVPGVHAIFTLADLLPHLITERLVVGLPSKSYKQDRNRPVLAHDEVVHVGEPIAIVVAENRYIAEDAAQLVEIDYEPLPAAADCRAALEPNAPRVHRNAPHNLLAEFAMTYGDVDRAFAGAPHVLREALKVHRGGSHS